MHPERLITESGPWRIAGTTAPEKYTISGTKAQKQRVQDCMSLAHLD
jgi:hypothetical protein